MLEFVNDDVALLLPFILIGFLAQAMDGALGMAFGVIVNTILIGFMGVPPARASYHVHIVKIFTTAASGMSHYYEGNVDFRLFFSLLIPSILAGILGAFLLSYLSGTSTAAPSNSPSRNCLSASFALVRGNGVVVVRTGILAAISRNSSPSCRVRLATDRRTRSSHKIL